MSGTGPSAEPEDAIRTLLILGATGDLTARLLLPGVARLIASGRASTLRLVGAGNSDWSQSQWRDVVSKAFTQALPEANSSNEQKLAEVLEGTSYEQLDVTEEGALAGVLNKLEEAEQTPVAVYFALPPAVSQKACELLSPEDVPPGTRLVMEKPFGSSAASAHQLNQVLAALVPEERIHRVDHFLGKSTVFNILGLRFANQLLEPLWNARHIQQVEIIFDEELGLENRAGYYDRAGALRDMVQSHLLQIMAIIAMEPPATLDERDVRDGVSAVLRASTAAPEQSLRARYTAGQVSGGQVPDYTAEDGVDPGNNTETLAQIEVRINNWRWAGVPFILRSGKALGKTRKEAVITYLPVPHLPTGFRGTDTPTQLHIGFGPDTLQLDIDVNGPGDLFTLNSIELCAELAADPLLPYGEVLDSVLKGDPLLSVRGDAAELSWGIIEPTLAHWAEQGSEGLSDYPAGSQGPEEWTTNNPE